MQLIMKKKVFLQKIRGILEQIEENNNKNEIIYCPK